MKRIAIIIILTLIATYGYSQSPRGVKINNATHLQGKDTNDIKAWITALGATPDTTHWNVPDKSWVELYFQTKGTFVSVEDTGVYVMSRERANSTFEPKLGIGTTSQFLRGDKTWQTVSTTPDTSHWNIADKSWVYGYSAKKDSIPFYSTLGRTTQKNPNDSLLLNGIVTFKGTGVINSRSSTDPAKNYVRLIFNGQSGTMQESVGYNGSGVYAGSSIIHTTTPAALGVSWLFNSSGLGTFKYNFSAEGFYPSLYSTAADRNQFLGVPLYPWNDGYLKKLHITEASTGTTSDDIAMINSSGDVRKIPTSTFSQPLNNNKKIVYLGNSITSQAIADTPPLVNEGSTGYYVWGNAILGQPFSEVINKGIGGQVTSEILARFRTDVLAYNPGYCFLEAGVNDGDSATVTFGHLKQIWDSCTLNHIVPIASTVTPYYAQTAALKRQKAKLNQMIKDYCFANNITLVDFESVVARKDTADWRWQTLMSSDGIHPVRNGALAMGKEYARTLASILPPVNQLPVLMSDPNVVSKNHFLTGTAGTTTTPTLVTGSIADTCSIAATCTTVVSKVARNYGSWQKIVISSVGAVTFQVNDARINFSVGDTVFALSEIKVGNDYNLLKGTKLVLEAIDNTNTVIYTITNMYYGASAQYLYNMPPEYLLKTKYLVVPTGTVKLRLSVVITATAGTYYIGRPCIKKYRTAIGTTPLSTPKATASLIKNNEEGIVVDGVVAATGGTSTDWNAKQPALVSGTNLKTINSTSLLGSGDITIPPSPWSTNSTSLYYNGGNVGIGTSAPTQLLTVAGGIASSGDVLSTGSTMSIGGASSQQYYVTANYFAPTATNSRDLGRAAGTWKDGYFGGKIGIGTTAPLAKTQINQSAAGYVFAITNSMKNKIQSTEAQMTDTSTCYWYFYPSGKSYMAFKDELGNGRIIMDTLGKTTFRDVVVALAEEIPSGGAKAIQSYGTGGVEIWNFGSTPSLNAKAANTSTTDFTGVVSGRVLWSQGFQAANGSAISAAKGSFKVVASEAWTTSANGLEMYWETCANGSTTKTERMRLKNNGVLEIPKIKQATTDTTGMGSTANVGMMMYYNGHFYGLKAGTPPVWTQLDN